MLQARCLGETCLEKREAPPSGGASRFESEPRVPSGRRRLFGNCRVDADLVAALVLVLELHDAFDEREDRVVVAHADVGARMPLRSALADNDVAGDHALAAELLDAAVFRIAVAPVSRRADAFLMSHMAASLSERDVRDADFGEALPVPLLAGVVLPALELEDDDLLAAAVLDDLAGHLGTGQRRNAGVHGAAVGAEENVIEFD